MNSRRLNRYAASFLLAVLYFVSSALAQPLKQAGRYDSDVVLVLRPHGFEPAQMTIKKGNVRILVFNRSGYPNVSFQLQGLAGGPKALAIPGKQSKLRQVEDLTPGSYAGQIPALHRAPSS